MADRQALVLICGIGEDEATWEPVVAALGEIADCLPMVAGGDSIEAMADDILARIDGNFAVAGHSLGGYVALCLQRIAPDRVTRLALLNTSARPDDAATAANRRKLIARIARDGYPAVVRAITPMLSAKPSPAEAATMLLRTGETRFVREQRAAMLRPDARPALAAITVPLLVIGGARDQVIPVARSVEIATAVPGATLVTLPGSGHMSPVEAPAAVAMALLDWLATPLWSSPVAPETVGSDDRTSSSRGVGRQRPPR